MDVQEIVAQLSTAGQMTIVSERFIVAIEVLGIEAEQADGITKFTITSKIKNAYPRPTD